MITKAYKLLKLRANNTLGPLFINTRQVIEPGTWMKAEAHETRGFAFRPFWHAAPQPCAPHLRPKGRVWMHVELRDVQEYARPKSQGGSWYLAGHMCVLGPVSEDEIKQAKLDWKNGTIK